MRLSHALIVVGLLCSAALGFGFNRLWQYEALPGPPAKPPKRYTGVAGLPHAPGRATLVMLAHPRCPCTRASVEELARLMARCQGRVAATVLFVKPAGVPDGWEKGGLWRATAALPGVRVLTDEDGILARRLGGSTSGQVLLYDRDGQLMFAGGITSTRGQAGDNAGADAIHALVF